MKTEDIKPWYRQFWFWFVFGPLIFVVCLSVVTVSIAFHYADDVVIDNYYKAGRAINQTLDQDRRARDLNLTARLHFDRAAGEVFVEMPEAASLPDNLLLRLAHPFEADLDQQAVLVRTSVGHYRGSLNRQIEYSWYLSLLPFPNESQNEKDKWLLSGEINFSHGDEIVLKPRVDN